VKFRDLHIPIESAKKNFQSLREKYPTLSAYIVISSRYGQIVPHASGLDALSEFPSFFLDSAGRRDSLQILEKVHSLDRELKSARAQVAITKRRSMKALRDLLEHSVRDLVINELAQVEIRFDVLDYEVVRALRVDPLVSRDLTPQTNASIQIVLGALREFIPAAALCEFPTSEGEVKNDKEKNCPEERRVPKKFIWMPYRSDP
jgi:hypothetical protein